MALNPHHASPLEAFFLDAEDADRHAAMAVLFCAVFEGAPPPLADITALIARGLPDVPRLSAVVHEAPFGLGPPVWVPAPAVDLSYHVRRTALPSPGGEAQLRQLIARIAAQRLDRDRPLWEVWLVENLQSLQGAGTTIGIRTGGWALVTKMHPCLSDGVTDAGLARLLLKDEAGQPEPPVDRWLPHRTPGLLSLAAGALGALATQPVVQGRAAGRALAAPCRSVRRAGQTGRALLSLTPVLAPVQPTSLTGSYGSARRYQWARIGLADVAQVRSAFGGTRNDVTLAAVTAAFRNLLIARGERPGRRAVCTLIPVPPEGSGRHSSMPRLSLTLMYLPVDEPDPVLRLRAVQERTAHLKASGQAAAGQTLLTVAGLQPFLTAKAGFRTTARLLRRRVTTVTATMPGPPRPAHILGRPLVEMFPYIPLANDVRLAIAQVSYRGHVTFGITGDYDTAPDVELLARGIERGIEELVTAAGGDGRVVTGLSG